MGRAERLTTQIKAYDRELYVERDGEGKLCVYRKSKRWETYHLSDNCVLRFVRPTPHFIFALTHDWKASGRVVDWGVEPILARLKACDLWQRDLAEEIIQDEEKRLESVARERQNTTESFLLDFRKQFAKSFNDVNTSTMSKREEKRRLGDKMIKGI